MGKVVGARFGAEGGEEGHQEEGAAEEVHQLRATFAGEVERQTLRGEMTEVVGSF